MKNLILSIVLSAIPLFASAGNYEAFETDVWQKVHGEWKIISLHYSEITSE